MNASRGGNEGSGTGGRSERGSGAGGRGQRGSGDGSGRGGGRPARIAGPAKTPGRGRPRRNRPAADRPEPAVDVHDPDGIRLQKLLAGAGLGSRRACEQIIADGRVQVDGVTVRELGVRVDPARQTVHVDGDRIVLGADNVYLAFNKPLGVVTTMEDELGRPSIADYLTRSTERLFHVGRLDADTEGLLLLTNDGELAHRLQHPKYGVSKTYVAIVPGPLPRDLGKRLREGVDLDDGPARADSFRVVDSSPGRAVVEIVLHEGRKHIVRRMLAAVGHPVEALSRTQVGSVHLGDTRPGRTRALSDAEVRALYREVGL